MALLKLLLVHVILKVLSIIMKIVIVFNMLILKCHQWLFSWSYLVIESLIELVGLHIGIEITVTRLFLNCSKGVSVLHLW